MSHDSLSSISPSSPRSAYSARRRHGVDDNGNDSQDTFFRNVDTRDAANHKVSVGGVDPECQDGLILRRSVASLSLYLESERESALQAQKVHSWISSQLKLKFKFYSLRDYARWHVIQLSLLGKNEKSRGFSRGFPKC